MTSSVTVSEAKPLVHRLKSVALRTFQSLIALSHSESDCAAEVQDKFYAAVSDIVDIRIEQLPNEAGTFYVSEGVLYLSEVPVAQILLTATEDFERRYGANKSTVSAKELPRLLEKVFIDFLLHEIRHRTQGVGAYDAVQNLKAVAGRSAMSELDSNSDRDAAWAYASVEAGWSDRSRFLEKFREALFLSSDYYFRVFPVTASRHDKIERAISVMLMAARLARVNFDEPITERADLPLDAVLSVVMASNKRALAIYRGEPSKRLLGVANDTDDVSGLVADITAGRYDVALQRSVGIMSRLNLLG